MVTYSDTDGLVLDIDIQTGLPTLKCRLVHDIFTFRQVYQHLNVDWFMTYWHSDWSTDTQMWTGSWHIDIQTGLPTLKCRLAHDTSYCSAIKFHFAFSKFFSSASISAKIAVKLEWIFVYCSLSFMTCFPNV